jgi:hypothetical protein
MLWTCGTRNEQPSKVLKKKTCVPLFFMFYSFHDVSINPSVRGTSISTFTLFIFIFLPLTLVQPDLRLDFSYFLNLSSNLLVWISLLSASAPKLHSSHSFNQTTATSSRHHTNQHHALVAKNDSPDWARHCPDRHRDTAPDPHQGMWHAMRPTRACPSSDLSFSSRAPSFSTKMAHSSS